MLFMRPGYLSQYSVWLRAGRSGFDSRQRQKDFSTSLSVETGSRAHPDSCTMDTWGSFPGAKARPGRDADDSPHLVSTSRMSRSYTSSPPSASVACSGTALAFMLLMIIYFPNVHLNYIAEI
jgi:hypothetical protein